MKNVLDSFKTQAVPLLIKSNTDKKQESKIMIVKKQKGSSAGQTPRMRSPKKTASAPESLVDIAVVSDKNSVSNNKEDTNNDYDEDDFLADTDDKTEESKHFLNTDLLDDAKGDGNVSQSEVVSIFSEIIESEHEMIKKSLSQGPMSN